MATTHGAYLSWQRNKMREVMTSIDQNQGWPEAEVAAVRDYLSRREGSFDAPAVPGLVKRDLGLRDALGLLEPTPHISGFLDWELVELGDTLWALVDVFVVLFVAGLGRTWRAFREGYEREAGTPVQSGEALEYYTLVRTLIALTWREDAARREQARELSRRLLDGESPVVD